MTVQMPKNHRCPVAFHCRRCNALIAFIEQDDKLLWLRMATGLMRLPRRHDGRFSARYGLPQGARRGIHPPLRRSVPSGESPQLANAGGFQLREDLRWVIQVYCPNCHSARVLDTTEFPEPYRSSPRPIVTDRFGPPPAGLPPPL